MNPDLLTEDVLDRLSIPISALGLPARALHVFQRLGVNYAGEVVQLQLANLIGTPNFGWRSFRAVESALDQIGLCFGMATPNWTSEYAVARNEELAREFRKLLPIRQPAPAELKQALFKSLADVERSGRNVDIIAQYLGWDGKGGTTLEKAAIPYGLTRERVRQLVARALDRLKDHPPPPVLIRALTLIEREAPLSRARAADLPALFEFSDMAFDVYGLLSAASAFDLKCPWEIADVGTSELVTAVGGGEALARAVKLARRLSSSRGCVDLYQLPVEAELEHPYSTLGALQEVFDHLPEFEWLDRVAGWLWRRPEMPGSRNRLLNDLRKLLAASHAISVQELRIGLRRDPRMGGFAPPISILRAICSRTPFATLAGDSIRRIEQRENWNGVLGSVETILVDVLQREGPVLHRVPFLNACLKRGMLEGTFGMYTSTSPLLWRPAPGLFALLGSEIQPGLIEELQGARPTPQVESLDSGWTHDGLMYAAWQLNERRAASGKLYVPAALQRLLQGEWASVGSGDSQTNTITVDSDRLTGLRPAIPPRRRRSRRCCGNLV